MAKDEDLLGLDKEATQQEVVNAPLTQEMLTVAKELAAPAELDMHYNSYHDIPVVG